MNLTGDRYMDGWMDEAFTLNLHLLKPFEHIYCVPYDQPSCVLGTVSAVGDPQAILLHVNT